MLQVVDIPFVDLSEHGMNLIHSVFNGARLCPKPGNEQVRNGSTDEQIEMANRLQSLKNAPMDC